MKMTIFAGALVAAVSLAGAASAQNYFQANVGMTLNASTDFSASIIDGVDTFEGSQEFDIDNSFLVSGAFGRDNGAWRFEGELLYTKGDVEDATLTDGAVTEDLGEVSVSQLALMVNVLYDFGSSDRFQPYVGAGIGYGATRFEAPDLDEDDASTGVTWQVKAGVTFGNWDIGYRYLKGADFDADYSEPGYSQELDAETTTHALTIGLRF
ncbi:MAG: porin family protein [Pseudomonadota bacterium]